jgi:hypothetical protein
VTPWFIATRPFTPESGEQWQGFVRWSGLTQLTELVSLDSYLCPALLEETRAEYWPHIVQEDFMLHFFLDYDFLMQQVAPFEKKNVLCVFRNPSERPTPPSDDFEFLGYEVVDIHGDVSALCNCGGYPGIFEGSELSHYGLLNDLDRAMQIQKAIRESDPGGSHSDCHVWAIFRRR